jgi:pimeloyl-ACP methyl ester carboxylesterase
MANVNGVRLHFVSGGAGPAPILIHGFPQDWTEYRAIMPRVAKRFTVMALDVRGIGQSSMSPPSEMSSIAALTPVAMLDPQVTCH